MSNALEHRVFAVERALILLQCFEYVDERRTLASLSRQSGLYKSTILRLANSLCKMGYLSRRTNGLFELGPAVTRLASLSRISIDVEARVRSELKRLASKTQEGAAFYIRQGRYRVCLFRQDEKGDSRVQAREGSRSLLNDGAAAQVLKAFGKSSTDPLLLTVRLRGWAISRGDHHRGLAAVAVPLFNRDKELLGAIAVTGLEREFSLDRERHLQKFAAAAAQALAADMRFVHTADLASCLLPHTPEAARKAKARRSKHSIA